MSKKQCCQERDAILDFVEIGSAVYHWCINLGDAPIGKFTGKRMINRRGFGLPVQTSHNSVI